MNKLLLLVSALALSACGPNRLLEHERRAEAAAAAAAAADIAPTRGEFVMSGGGMAEIRTFTIDGTRCIYVGRYSGMSISCDWKNQ